MHDTGHSGLVHWDDQRDGMGREVGGVFRMGNMCIPVADSCWCMAKPIQYCKILNNNKKIPFMADAVITIYNQFSFFSGLVEPNCWEQWAHVSSQLTMWVREQKNWGFQDGSHFLKWWSHWKVSFHLFSFLFLECEVDPVSQWVSHLPSLGANVVGEDGGTGGQRNLTPGDFLQ